MSNIKIKYQHLFTWYIDSMARSAYLRACRIKEASGLKQRLIVCVLPVKEWLVSNVVTNFICTHKFGTASKILQQLRNSVSRKPWHSFAENRGPAEPTLRNIGLGKFSLHFKPEIPFLIDWLMCDTFRVEWITLGIFVCNNFIIQEYMESQCDF
jgi:hypothetical protein